MSRLEPARPQESRVPVSPQMAWRVAVIGTLALVMFGIIFFRLWYLQILTGNHYLAEATSQKLRPLPIAAPRGQILASGGQTLVASQTTSAVRIVPSKLPESIDGQFTAYREAVKAAVERGEPVEVEIKSLEARLDAKHTPAERREVRRERAQLKRLHAHLAKVSAISVPPLPASNRRLWGLFRRLGGLLGIPARKIDERVIQQLYISAYAPVTIDTAVGAGLRTVLYERQREFPGVEESPVATRTYPHGEMAAQVFGYVSSINEEQLKSKAFKGVAPGTEVGQGGLEYEYDNVLRGVAGKKQIEVNALGEPIGSAAVKEVQPKPGYNLKTTINLPLQIEAEKAFREESEAAKARGRVADGGGFVAMDPLSGEVLAMGSYPSYDPSFFTKPFTQAAYEALTKEPKYGVTGGDPLFNRATQAGYPTGSTFKPITAMAALEEGIITPEQVFGAGKCIYVSAEPFCNDNHEEYGATDLVQALEVSSDVYFFTVGERAYYHGDGDAIQRMAHKLGIGDETGIDLPSPAKGLVPDAKWLQKLNAEEARCTKEKHGKPCGYVLEPGELWTVGHNMHFALGQGELLTNPLQMAVAYSTLVDAYRNEGRGWRPTPHLGKAIVAPDGELVRELKFPPAKAKVELNPAYLGYVFEGIHDATVGPHGTSTTVWHGWNQALHETYGKTGTAEILGQTEQSWYMCYIASEKRPIVIAVTMEQGGYGAEAAAPIARLIADQYYNQPKVLVKGSTVPEN